MAASLAAAREFIRARIGSIEACSGLCRSRAWGFEGDDFTNQAMVVETRLEPVELLDMAEQIEKELGRHDKCRDWHAPDREYEPRAMDIDIIFYDGISFNNSRLSIPHPLVARRRFALEPLNEIIPGYVHPALGRSIRELLEEL